MDWRIFGVLLWKHWCVRKRRIIVTALEYITPILLFVLVFVFKNMIVVTPSTSTRDQKFEIQRPEPTRLNWVHPPSFILFTPNTNFTRRLMESVGKKLDREPLETFQSDKTGYYALNDTSEISNITSWKAMKDNEALVIFENSEAPQNLKYTIRMKRHFLTITDFAADSELVPHENFGTIYETFMRLQWAIDTSFLELRTGKQIKQDVTLQEFPYVERASTAVADFTVAVLGSCCFCSLLIMFTLLVGRLVGERVNGMQELMKMSGVSSGMLAAAHFVDTLPGVLSFSLAGGILLTVGEPVLLENTSGLLLFVSLLLHSCTLVAFGFVCGYLLRSLEYINTLAATIFIALSILTDWLSQAPAPALQLLLGVVPAMPMRWLQRQMAILAKYNLGLTFSTLATTYDPKAPSALVALVYMAAQTALFMLLAWYLDHVCPGKLGLAMPWNFFCQKQYWRKNNVVPDLPPDEQETMAAREERYYEPAPAHADAGIRVNNITKIFGKFRALNDVSLDVYKGELTILLGHNGAGKTTLMSIMTGTLNPSAGQVLVNGQDIAMQQRARRQVGFCPQHNVFFPHLSVIEHVVLFSMLRGQSRSEAWKSSKLLLERLGIEAKATALSATLSGGMRRRLQMACALAGDAPVVVLDEPSSGLDVETRRGLWDLVLGLRGNRTVLISTHFMEEADALGDRVAALHRGVLRCHATPMYLKKAIGTGYRLTFTTIGQPNEAAISSVVMGAVPDAAVKEVTMNAISFGLPAASSGAFPSMFAALESRRSDLGIDSIGVGVSTLEEVFLQLCSDIDTSSLSQDEVDGVSTVEPTYTRRTGLSLYLLQFFELLKRQLAYLWHKKYSFLIWQVVIPIAIVVVVGQQTTNGSVATAPHASPRVLSLAAYGPGYRVLHAARAGPHVRALAARYPAVQFERADDVDDAVLRTGINDILDYQKYLAGIEINDTNAKVMYTTTVRHAAPAALSLLANVLASMLVPGEPPSLTVVNDPIDVQNPVVNADFRQPKHISAVYTFTFIAGSVLLFNTMNAAHLAITERVSGARRLLLLGGCTPELLWAAALAGRALLALLAYAAPVLLVCACDADDTFDEPHFMAAWFVVMTLGILAFLAMVFLVTLYFNQLGTNTFLSLCVFASLMLYLMGVWSLPGSYVHVLATLSYHVLPPHATLRGLSDAALSAHANALCALNRDRCSLFGPRCCETDTNQFCMFCFGTDAQAAPGYSMLILGVQFIVYMSLVFAAERGVVSWVRERLKARCYAAPARRFGDDMVRAERAYVAKAIELPPRQIQDVMLVSDLHKVHNTVLNRFTAIRGISFSVKKGECLGLLGVNGAGKSSAFRVLTAEDWATRGSVFAAGHHRQGFTTDYMRGLGYCPQFFGLDDFLTGRQNLRLLLALKGLRERDAAAETASWIRIVGLEQYMDRKVSGYSGGCQRRLAAAAALAAGAPLTLLDEPTSGVDVSARRRVWAALRRGLAHQRAVIITSHSMDEMEALCHRIAIMSGGELVALGAPAALRAAHAAGHAVVIKVRAAPAHAHAHAPAPAADHPHKRSPSDETDSTASSLNRLKGTLRQKFDCTLKDEHKTMLHYHINQTMQYSRIFEEMELLKASFPDYVEDYSVTETTLEEVFLSFARRAERLAERAEPSAAPSAARAPDNDPEARPRPV